MSTISKIDLKILLLEGVHQNAVDYFAQAGFNNIETLPKALSEDELCEKIKDVSILGIRSRSQITRRVLDAAPQLMGIGCFCIGINQVDIESTQSLGIPVFNAPLSNTRSVAELTIGSIIHLMRGIPAKNLAAHRGEWHKSADHSFEIRGKKLGIVGYGNIGSQLSVLASGLGMHVYYYDIEKKLSHGNARSTHSLKSLLEKSDVVTLHVPETRETNNIINSQTLSWMKPGSFLINYARGNCVEITDLKEALNSGHIAGAALDVFPVEPKSKSDEFESPLRDYDQVLISPHIGGSTQEAQASIGLEVAEKLIEFYQDGSTKGAVNFPKAVFPTHVGSYRILNVHKNIPGMIGKINDLLMQHNINILGQFLQTDGDIGYVVIDIDILDLPNRLQEQIDSISGSIRTRFISQT